MAGYTKLHRRIEKVALGSHALMSTLLAWRIASEVRGFLGVAAVIGGALGGYLMADFVSGVIHWLADHYGSESTPLVGGPFVRTFREHHRDPQAITRHDFVETNGDSCIVTAPVAFVHAFAIALGLGVVLTTQAHKWAHSANPPRFVRALQRWRLILSPRHHAGHHRGDHDSCYCITTGWLDPVLAAIDAWGKLERALARAGVSRTA